MTSMPASRSARAMILAPRSCPSRPGFAITTRIFWATVPQVYEREVDRSRLLAGVAEPRWRAVRLPRRGTGAPAPRLRPRRARAAAPGRGLAGGGRDRDHALAPRPLGRPRALGLGRDVRPRRGPAAAGALDPAGGLGHAGRDLLAGRPDAHVLGRLRGARVRRRRAVPRGGLRRRGPAGRALRPARLRLPRLGERRHARLLGGLG